MALLRSFAKIFFLNEVEACQLVILLKNIGWEPCQMIKQNLQTFSPPGCFLETVRENQMHFHSVLAQLMILCLTAKKLLNDPNSVLIIQKSIEMRSFPEFGNLFNLWIKCYEPCCTVSMKKINKLYNHSINQTCNYTIPNSSAANRGALSNVLDKRAPLTEKEVSQYAGTRKSSIDANGNFMFDETMSERNYELVFSSTYHLT